MASAARCDIWIGDLSVLVMEVDDVVDKSKRDFEGLSDRSHCLPLEVGVDGSLPQIERVKVPHRARAQRTPLSTCSDLTPTNYPYMEAVTSMSLDKGSGEPSSCSRRDANCCNVLDRNWIFSVL